MNLPLLSLVYASVLLGACVFVRACVFVCMRACMQTDSQSVSMILVSELSCDC